MNQAQWLMKTKVCPLYLVASDKGLQGVYWDRQEVAMVKSLRGSQPEVQHLARAVGQLEEYFAGKRRTFDLQLDIQGTEFQKRVWAQLQKIPYGKTYSYSDVARRIENPKAMRAVGSANGKNPVCIIIPCHRVIAADGTLGGFGGGLDIKEKLLNLEQRN